MPARILVISKLDSSKGILYTIDEKLSGKELKRCAELLTNPLIEESKFKSLRFTEIGFLPGVTDNIGNTATEMLGHKTYSSYLYFKNSPPLNPLIQRSSKNKFLPVPRVILPEPKPIQIINLDISDEELMKISRNRTLALDLPSMHAIRNYKSKLTDVELEALAQTWSEHCKHTIFADPIDDIENGLFKTYIKGATEKLKAKSAKLKAWLVSVFTDNSGAIIFDKNYLITHKVETHNTPSALDPFGGAVTGIVGVNRDTLGFGLGAKPIANFYGFCLGYPEGVRYPRKRYLTPLYRDAEKKKSMLSARRIMDGVIEGINAGGNQSGIPTPQGFLYFHDRYRGKPLVFAGTIGLIPEGVRYPRKRYLTPLYIKKAMPGDYVVMAGGRVGADGIHGATFSSEVLNPNSPATAVQIGDPITQKKFSDAIVKEARDQGLYTSITDCGAGGLSSAVGEMALQSGGCEVDLDKVPLKYPGLESWQIWISESQERMVLAVPPKKWLKFRDLMARRGVEAAAIGKFTESGKCVVKHNGKIVMNLEMSFLHNGRPTKRQVSKKPQPVAMKNEELRITNEKLLKILADPNITSFEFVSRQYDHTVQGTGVVGPLQGKGMVNGNASVIAPVLGSKRGMVMTHALAPEMTETNPYGMAVYVVKQAVQNAIAIGADPEHIALLDNFCWCSSNEPERLWQLKEACRGCYDAALEFGTPFISGKDSMFNDFKGYDAKGKPIKISIPPTLLISAIGIIPDVTKAVTENLKNPGDLIYILSGGTAQWHKYHQATQKKLIASAISIGLGGIHVALAKTAIAGQLGLDVSLSGATAQSGIIVSVSPKNKKAFEKIMPKNGVEHIGSVTSDLTIVVKNGTHKINLSVKEATKAYKSTFKNF